MQASSGKLECEGDMGEVRGDWRQERDGSQRLQMKSPHEQHHVTVAAECQWHAPHILGDLQRFAEVNARSSGYSRRSLKHNLLKP